MQEYRDDAIIGRDASLTDAARVSQPGFSGSRTKPVMATKGHRQLSRREQASQDMSIELTFGSDGAKIKKSNMGVMVKTRPRLWP